MTSVRSITSAGCLIASLLLAGGCAQPQWDLGMQTYTFRTYTLLESIDKVDELGLEHIEAFSGQKVGAGFGDMVLDHNASAEARQAVRDKLEATGVKMTAYYFHHLGHDEASSRKIFELAGEMGVSIIVSEPPPDKIAMVDELAQEYEIDVAIHEHARNPKTPEYTYWNPEAVMEVLEGTSERMGTCADTGHWTRSGVDPVEGLKTYEGRLKCMHLKDMNARKLEGHDVVWGTGVTGMKAVLAEMMRQGFDGLACIEYEENPQDNMTEVAACIEWHNETVKKLSK